MTSTPETGTATSQDARGGGSPPAPPPSGEQYELRHADQAVTVVEVGGGIRSYAVAGAEMLDGYAVDEMCTGARGQTLVPWPNRVRDGRYEFDGETYQLPLAEPEKGNAIHGLLRWSAWAAVEQGPTRVVLACRLHPQAGYPFTLDVRNEYALGPDGLTVTTVATNVGARACPYALGFHPYLGAGLARVDGATVTIAAETYLPTDDRGIPTGRRPVAGTPYDFREPRRLGDVEIDYTFTDLRRDARGRAAVTVADADRGRAVTLWVDESFAYLEIFTGDALPEPERRRAGLGVEPMTAPPDAMRTGTDLRRLAPGDTATTTWGIRAGVDPA